MTTAPDALANARYATSSSSFHFLLLLFQRVADIAIWLWSAVRLAIESLAHLNLQVLEVTIALFGDILEQGPEIVGSGISPDIHADFEVQQCGDGIDTDQRCAHKPCEEIPGRYVIVETLDSGHV